MHPPNVQWQPISALPLVAMLIDEGLKDALELLETLREAEDKPHVLDDATVERVEKVWGERGSFLAIYDEQLGRWTQLALTDSQSAEVKRLADVLAQTRPIVTAILELAKQLKTGTIDSIMRKSDLELGLEVLTGVRRP
jgi:hypothetical protein